MISRTSIVSKQQQCLEQPKPESVFSSPRTSPSLISPALSAGRYFSSETTRNRIIQQFPKVGESYINHLMRLYHNRENLVISALLSEGHSRNNIMLDESLFYKIKAAFPNVETEVIRKLLIKNDNKEHRTIQAILGLFGLFNTARYEYSQCPQMKLKYLKFAYPDVDEIILLDLLFNNDNNVNKVIEHLKNLGHCTSELKVKILKISETAIVKEATEKLNAPRPVSLPIRTKHHANLEEQEIIRRKFIEKFPEIDTTIINAALEACGFEHDLAEHFLRSMTPQDSDKYFIRTLPDIPLKLYDKQLISRSTQTNYKLEDLFGQIETFIPNNNENSKEAIEDKQTWTKEDGIIIPKVNKRSKGPILKAIGASKPNPNYRLEIIRSSLEAKGPDPNLKIANKGSNESYKTKSIGSQLSNRKGSIGKQIKTLKEQFPDVDENDI